MAEKPRMIKVTQGSDLAKVLAGVGSASVILDKDGELYGLVPVKIETERPSSEVVTRSEEGILKAAGSWKDIDAEGFKAYISNRLLKNSNSGLFWGSARHEIRPYLAPGRAISTPC